MCSNYRPVYLLDCECGRYHIKRAGHPGVPGAPVLYADLPLSTAARLSATFPIVSSGTRIPPAYTPHAYHFLDGGYFDNDGTAFVIELLKSALGEPDSCIQDCPGGQMPSTSGPRIAEKPLKIVLIEIRDDDGKAVTTDMDSLARQDGSAPDDEKNPQAPRWTPLTQLTAVVGGLWNAGHSSIARRNRRELCTLEFLGKLIVRHIVFTIPNHPDGLSPLSWKLTTRRNDWIVKRARHSCETQQTLREVTENLLDLLPAPDGRSRDPRLVYPGASSLWREPSSEQESAQ